MQIVIRVILLSCFPFLISAFVTGCNSPAIDLSIERQALLDADAAWATAASTSDMENLWSFWSENAKMLMSADFTLKGHEEIKQFTIKVRQDPNFSINWTASGADVSPDGQMGYTYGIGEMTRTGEDGKVTTLKQPYLTVWKKQSDGSWKGVIEK